MMKDKQAQYSAFGDADGRTLFDLYREIRRDSALSLAERERTISAVSSQLGNPPSSTPLSSLMTAGVGSILGYVVSKYFGMGTIGRAITSAIGLGVGKTLHDRMAARQSPRGWQILS